MQTAPVSHWYGFGLSLLTAALWGMLPVFLKLTLEVMDAITVVWYRFAVSAVFVLILLARRNALPPLRGISRASNGLLLVAALGLIGNYILYLNGVDLLEPETAQVLIQLAPFLLMCGGIVLFKERFNWLETLGAVVLLSGLLLFFNDRLATLLTSMSQYTLGVLSIIAAAVTWAVYALSQKTLLKTLTARQLTAVFYTCGGLFLLPFIQPALILNMDGLQLAALAFACANTIVGYGAFTQAMNVWHASKVSAVIALAPLFTFISMELAVIIWPSRFVASDLNIWAYIGAGMVMCGSMAAALGRGKAN